MWSKKGRPVDASTVPVGPSRSIEIEIDVAFVVRSFVAARLTSSDPTRRPNGTAFGGTSSFENLLEGGEEGVVLGAGADGDPQASFERGRKSTKFAPDGHTSTSRSPSAADRRPRSSTSSATRDSISSVKRSA